MPTNNEATAAEIAEYERLYDWRARWTVLAKKREPGRTCSRQERIEKKALRCNLKIAQVMHAFDLRINNTRCPIGEKAVSQALRALLLAP